MNSDRRHGVSAFAVSVVSQPYCLGDFCYVTCKTGGNCQPPQGHFHAPLLSCVLFWYTQLFGRLMLHAPGCAFAVRAMPRALHHPRKPAAANQQGQLPHPRCEFSSGDGPYCPSHQPRRCCPHRPAWTSARRTGACSLALLSIRIRPKGRLVPKKRAGLHMFGSSRSDFAFLRFEIWCCLFLWPLYFDYPPSHPASSYARSVT